MAPTWPSGAPSNIKSNMAPTWLQHGLPFCRFFHEFTTLTRVLGKIRRGLNAKKTWLSWNGKRVNGESCKHVKEKQEPREQQHA